MNISSYKKMICKLKLDFIVKLQHNIEIFRNSAPSYGIFPFNTCNEDKQMFLKDVVVRLTSVGLVKINVGIFLRDLENNQVIFQTKR
jgi:hypothetical protein